MRLYFDDEKNDLWLAEESLQRVDDFEPLSGGGVCPAYDPNSEAPIALDKWQASTQYLTGTVAPGPDLEVVTVPHHGSKMSRNLISDKIANVPNGLVVKAEWVLSCVMSKENAQSFIGDLEERSQRIVQTKGRIGAMFYFWWNLIRSLPPVLFQAFGWNTKRTSVSASKVSIRKFDRIVVSTRKLDTIVTTHPDDDHKPKHHRFYI